MNLFLSMKDPESDLEAVFEDDGRVAYAHVVKDKRIMGDVWVYNRAPAPAQPEWTDRERAPFLNPRDYVTDDVAAKLGAGMRPGFAALARRDGPLARVLPDRTER